MKLLTEEIIVREVNPQILKRVAIMVTQKAKELVKKDIGFLRDSITYEINGNTITIGSDMPYAPVVEYGRAPGTLPPVDEIEKWAARHGMPGAGWPIAMNIKKNGIPEAPFLRPAIQYAKKDIGKIIQQVTRGEA